MKAVSSLIKGLAVVVSLALALWWHSSREPDRILPPAQPLGGQPAAALEASHPSIAQTSVAAQPAIRAAAPPPTVSPEFDSWAEKFQAAVGADAQAALLAEGESLALARRERMLNLIKVDPEAALQA